MNELNLVTIGLCIFFIIMAICVHEAAHAWSARLCGDNSLAIHSRVTLNPKSHIDPVGTLLVPALSFFIGGFLFGWAKPVEVDFSRLKGGKRDIRLVVAAGPMSNFAMALIIAGAYWVLKSVPEASFLLKGLLLGVSLNLSFMIFNLIPILPLDGGRILNTYLPDNWSREFEKMEPYGFFIVIGLSLMGFLKLIAPLKNAMMQALL